MRDRREAALGVVRRRRSERAALVDRARAYVDELGKSVTLEAAVVFGSVARGDFNVWSDVDVLLLVADLPPGRQDRLAMVDENAPAGVSPMTWTPDEFRAEFARGNPIAIEAAQTGVVLRGDERFAELTSSATRARPG